ncbi:hypothetical protein FOA43_003409 [Brettanomyces nanus]|uniref:UBX domain-containing protein n=1 Tax=Eeniella nana TaxID=13502 RepID=A0A875S525_EENNA|nr:uncharacterized protein FOA43_003409 [Brettanomyces nanus]QPG76023.1 hypothetical protein FOA43_003409 [Brettanomyces nanus]
MGVWEEEKLQQFKEVTNYDESTEQEKVLKLLRVCNWNLDSACVRYFDNDFPTLLDDETLNHEVNASINERPPMRDPFNGAGIGGSASAGVFDNRFLDLIPKLPKAVTISNNWKFQIGILHGQNINRGHVSMLAPVVFILMLFPRLLWALGWGLDKLLGSTFPNVFRFLGYRTGPTDFPRRPLYLTKEEISHYDIKNYIDETLGETSDLPVFRGGFNDAFNRSKSELKWLVCVLLNSQSDTSRKFVKTYLNDERFIEFVKRDQMILYIGDVSYPEPHEVGQVYCAYSVPFISLISNVSATGTTMPMMSVVSKHQSFEGDKRFTPEERRKLMRRLTRIVQRYEPQLIVQRTDKQEADLSRVLREQQDSAYQESLIKDMKKQEQKKRKQIIQQQQLEEEERQRESSERRKRLRKAAIYHYYIQKYNRDTSSWIRGEYTTIQLRNNKGQRVIRKFNKEDTTFDVFMFVECRDYLLAHGDQSENCAIKVLKADSKDEQTDGPFEYKFKFDLISPMPRLRLNPDREQFLAEVGELWPNGSLLIEKVDEEETDSESDV